METATDDRRQMNVRLDAKTYRRLKIQALDERRQMAQVVRDAIRNYLDIAAPEAKS